jgi:hypothetical protein
MIRGRPTTHSMIIDFMHMGRGCINCRHMVGKDGTVHHGSPRCSETCRICYNPCDGGIIEHSSGCYAVRSDGGGTSKCHESHSPAAILAAARANGCIEGQVDLDPAFVPPRR